MVACNMMERHRCVPRRYATAAAAAAAVAAALTRRTVGATCSGGPFCGQRLREWGDFVAGGESEDREYEAKVLGLGPLMQA